MSRRRRTPPTHRDRRTLEGNRTAMVKLVDRGKHQMIRFERYINLDIDAQYDEPLWRDDSVPKTVTVEIEGDPITHWHFACKACRDAGRVWEISVAYNDIKAAIAELLVEARACDAPLERSVPI